MDYPKRGVNISPECLLLWRKRVQRNIVNRYLPYMFLKLQLWQRAISSLKALGVYRRRCSHTFRSERLKEDFVVLPRLTSATVLPSSRGPEWSNEMQAMEKQLQQFRAPLCVGYERLPVWTFQCLSLYNIEQSLEELRCPMFNWWPLRNFKPDVALQLFRVCWKKWLLTKRWKSLAQRMEKTKTGPSNRSVHSLNPC